MCSDEGVEDRVVENAQTCLVIGKMMVSRLIVIIEDQSATSCDDSLGRLCNRQAVNLVQVAVERLHGGEGAHVPDPDHARDVGRDDLVGSWDPLHSNQTVVMAF